MITDRQSLHILLDRLSAIHHDLAEAGAGLATLHTEAAVAALESLIRRMDAAPAVTELQTNGTSRYQGASGSSYSGTPQHQWGE